MVKMPGERKQRRQIFKNRRRFGSPVNESVYDCAISAALLRAAVLPAPLFEYIVQSVRR